MISGERWHVDWYGFPTEDGWVQGTEGVTYCESRDIFYRPIDSPSRLRENLWHEVMHASLCGKRSPKKANWYANVDSPEHESVYDLGMFLSSFVRDNPDFVKWSEDWKSP